MLILGRSLFEQSRQDIFLAELWVIVMVLQVAVVPFNIHTDCSNTLRGVERGADWCTRLASHSADLWRRFWHLVQELGGISSDRESPTKAKAHATAAERRAMGRCIFEGNATADKKAKHVTASIQHSEWEQQAYKARGHFRDSCPPRSSQPRGRRYTENPRCRAGGAGRPSRACPFRSVRPAIG